MYFLSFNILALGIIVFIYPCGSWSLGRIHIGYPWYKWYIGTACVCIMVPTFLFLNILSRFRIGAYIL